MPDRNKELFANPRRRIRSRGLVRRASLETQRRAGFTLVELMISVVILTLCCGMLATTLSATGMHRSTNHEQGLAVEAARGVIEDMHNWKFGGVYTLYNADPNDDPDGPGTGPGKHFAVEGLSPADDDPDGFVGEVILPVNSGPLLESAVNQALGMPRDLNGDMTIDELDHTLDHIVLPVKVVLRWKGAAGVRTFEVDTMLADCEKLK